jgi:Xaa-Pro aminopeptidase
LAVAHLQQGTGLFPPGRVRSVAAATGEAGLDALLLTPGPDLRYVTGYNAHESERLTCLVIRADSDPVLVVPRLERRGAQASLSGAVAAEIVGWDETDDPYALVGRLVGAAAVVGLSDRMWALHVLRLRAALPSARQELASMALRELRARKSTEEVAALRAAAEAIDRVHAQVPGWLRPGRTEAEVAADIGEAILAEGHATVDFTIVGSGPNGASPHHTASDRVLRSGDSVVVDIGGTMPTGYCSDCTRTYAIGAPAADVAEYYAVLKQAQEAACKAVRPGVAAEAVDAAARTPISAAGYGDYFVHRTGHGIGLETHEDPYIVAGNTEVLQPGHAFSVEPGIYPGPSGARIEDIVVCTPDGCDRLNQVSRELIVVPA